MDGKGNMEGQQEPPETVAPPKKKRGRPFKNPGAAAAAKKQVPKIPTEPRTRGQLLALSTQQPQPGPSSEVTMSPTMNPAPVNSVAAPASAPVPVQLSGSVLPAFDWKSIPEDVAAQFGLMDLKKKSDEPAPASSAPPLEEVPTPIESTHLTMEEHLFFEMLHAKFHVAYKAWKNKRISDQALFRVVISIFIQNPRLGKATEFLNQMQAIIRVENEHAQAPKAPAPYIKVVRNVTSNSSSVSTPNLQQVPVIVGNDEEKKN